MLLTFYLNEHTFSTRTLMRMHVACKNNVSGPWSDKNVNKSDVYATVNFRYFNADGCYLLHIRCEVSFLKGVQPIGQSVGNVVRLVKLG